MAKLSDKEQQMLKALQAKAEAPDEPSVGRSIRVTLDLGDPEQVKRAQKYGLLPADDDDDEPAPTNEPEDGAPKRGGYFE